ncbi:MAG: hypothetical protein ACI4J7_03545 [Ruminiclostridium sp.]
MRDGERKERKEKKDFQPFCKKAGEKLSAASRKAGEKANIGGNSDKHTIPLSRIERKIDAEKL